MLNEISLPSPLEDRHRFTKCDEEPTCGHFKTGHFAGRGRDSFTLTQGV